MTFHDTAMCNGNADVHWTLRLCADTFHHYLDQDQFRVPSTALPTCSLLLSFTITSQVCSDYVLLFLFRNLDVRRVDSKFRGHERNAICTAIWKHVLRLVGHDREIVLLSL
jgi:hypothetical protein